MEYQKIINLLDNTPNQPTKLLKQEQMMQQNNKMKEIKE